MEQSFEKGSSIPLTEPTYFILLSLCHAPRHGYAIMKEVRWLSDERVILSTGTLYSALKRLLDLGWILRREDPESNHNGRIRKFYSLSPIGRNVLKTEIQRLENLVYAAHLCPLEEVT